MGMSQARLADAVGVTFQQIQKYEEGTNEIRVGRIKTIADVLQVTVSYLVTGAANERGASLALHITPDLLALSKALARLSDTRLRTKIVNMVVRISENQATPAHPQDR
jgi:transcriptional regulator with XRE-family HTH domain